MDSTKEQLVICARCRMHVYLEGKGALSRADDETEVCPGCGSDEAMVNLSGRLAQPPEAWPVCWLPISMEIDYGWHRHVFEIAFGQDDRNAIRLARHQGAARHFERSAHATTFPAAAQRRQRSSDISAARRPMFPGA